MISRRVNRFLLLGVGTLIWLALGGELLCRFQGNWRFDQLALADRAANAPDPIVARDAQHALVEQITYRKQADPSWFFLTPAHIEEPRSTELRERAQADPQAQGAENFVWNDALLADPEPDFVALIRQQTVPTLFSFHSYDGSEHPRYRLFPSNDFEPTPWITNRWGWLGADAGVRKPPRTIRVGIIGDSTSHNLYGMNLQSFLDAWTKHNGFDVRFEVFSIGRQGLYDEDELAALRYELGPMGLDYVYQYFAPSFSLYRQQLLDFADVPASVLFSGPPPLVPRGSGLAHRLLDPVAKVSALARDIRDIYTREAADSNLPEPRKPRVPLHLPSSREGAVVLADARGYPYFKALIHNLNAFKSIVDGMNATPLVSTERLCAWDGMVLNNRTNRRLYEVMNGPIFWPFSYRDLRRILDAHNGMIKAWATANGVAVVDIDGRMPSRPELCEDAQHDIEVGHRMRAWLIFEALIPQLERDLRQGFVPRRNGIDSDVHPYIDGAIKRVDRDAWLAAVDARERANLTLPGPVPLQP